MPATRFGGRLLPALALSLALAAPLHAQLANPSAAALGMGDNFTAAARGYAAVAWNPALLAARTNPAVSLNVASVRGITGLDPIPLSNFKDWEGKVVPQAVKADWLNRIRAQGGEQGTTGFDATWLAVQVGHFGAQLSTSGRAFADLSPGVAEFMMFGNATDSGAARSLDLTGSSMDMVAYTTAAGSFAQPFSVGGAGTLSFGITGTYTMGHFLVAGEESSGRTTASPTTVDLRFPLVHTRVSRDEGGFEGNSGGGFGLDAGIALQTLAGWNFGLTVHNIFNTFEWYTGRLRYRQGVILFDSENRRTSFESQSYDSAGEAVPAVVRTAISDMKFQPAVALGAAGPLLPRLTASADLRLSRTSILADERLHAGVGLEYRLFSFLPLRAGLSYVQIDDRNSGLQYGGGAAVDLGGLTISAALAQRSTDLGKDTIFMLALLSFGL